MHQSITINTKITQLIKKFPKKFIILPVKISKSLLTRKTSMVTKNFTVMKKWKMRLFPKWKGHIVVKRAVSSNKYLLMSETFLGTNRCVGLRKQSKTLKLTSATCLASLMMGCLILTESLSTLQKKFRNLQHPIVKCSKLNSLASSKLIKRLYKQTLQLGHLIQMSTLVKTSVTSDKNFFHS